MKQPARPPFKSRRLAGLLAGLGAVVCLELGLRCAEVAPPNLPVRLLFERKGPMFVRDGSSYVTNNSHIYSYPNDFPAEKPRGGVRIFIAGGSTALGFPWQGVFDPRRLLFLALHDLDPSSTYEVIQSAGMGYASFEVEPVVKEILENYEPDVIVLMVGHNEFLEKRFPEAETSAVRRLAMRLRLARVMTGLVRWATHDLDHDRSFVHAVTPEERELVFRDYRQRMQKIVDRCRERGVKIVLLTCPSNLRDFRPFGPSQVPLAEQLELDRRLQAGELETVRLRLADWQGLFPQDAWVAFESAWVYYRAAAAVPAVALPPTLGPPEQAAVALFRAAKETDLWPIRAPDEINRILRDLGREPGVYLADAEREIGQLFSPPGLTDSDYFLDHCHLSLRAYPYWTLSALASLGESGRVHLPPGWKARSLARWSDYQKSLSPEQLSDCYLRLAVETGFNMGRVNAGLKYIALSLKANPDNPKAQEVRRQLLSFPQASFPMTGD